MKTIAIDFDGTMTRQDVQEFCKEMMEKGEGFGDDMTEVEKFIDHLVSKYINAPLAQIKKRGMKTHLYDKWAFKDDKQESKRLNQQDGE